jgi:hypothetical protein
MFIVSFEPESYREGNVDCEVWLRMPDKSFVRKSNKITGTGFLIGSKNGLYFVTARHVAINFNESSILFLQKDAQSIPVTASDFVGKGFTVSNWVHHTNADLSVLPIHPSAEFQNANLGAHAMSIEWVGSATNAPSRDVRLLTLGFPLAIGAVGSFSPISRHTSAASEMLSKDGAKYFLLEDPSVQGYSGSPLFDTHLPIMGQTIVLNRANHPDIVGVISGTLSDSTGGKMAIVIPSQLILELIRKAEM